MRFEYKTVEIDEGDSVKEEILDEYGRGGYELACVLPFKKNTRHMHNEWSGVTTSENMLQLIFKRRVE